MNPQGPHELSLTTPWSKEYIETKRQSEIPLPQLRGRNDGRRWRSNDVILEGGQAKNLALRGGESTTKHRSVTLSRPPLPTD
jgi:hypothetical protein